MKHIYNSGILGMQMPAVTLALYYSKGMTGFSLIKTRDLFFSQSSAMLLIQE